MTEALSVAILAGGKSSRMNQDKAFLQYKGKAFVDLIFNEMKKVSTDVKVVIGKKDKARFQDILGSNADIVNDIFDLDNPMGGMMTACSLLDKGYVAFIACDLPLVRSELVFGLYQRALGHSAAIPRWNDGHIEPLCAVYNVEQTRKAGDTALKAGKIGCKNLISYLKDVVFIDTEELRRYDPQLVSFLNINSAKDLAMLMQYGSNS